MKKSLIFVGLALFLILGISVIVYGQNSTTDVIEVIYAAEFTANPTNVESDSWIVEIAGGETKSINVLYGAYVVHTGVNTNFTGGSGQDLRTELIRLEGENGFWRFAGRTILSNTISSVIISEFWFYNNEALRGEDGSIPIGPPIPIEAVYLTRHFDESGNLINITINAQSGEKQPLESKGSVSGTNFYEIEIDTLNQFGDSTVGSN